MKCLRLCFLLSFFSRSTILCELNSCTQIATQNTPLVDCVLVGMYDAALTATAAVPFFSPFLIPNACNVPDASFPCCCCCCSVCSPPSIFYRPPAVHCSFLFELSRTHLRSFAYPSFHLTPVNTRSRHISRAMLDFSFSFV